MPVIAWSIAVSAHRRVCLDGCDTHHWDPESASDLRARQPALEERQNLGSLLIAEGRVRVVTRARVLILGRHPFAPYPDRGDARRVCAGNLIERAEPQRPRVRNGGGRLWPRRHYRERARPNADLRQRESMVVAQRARESRGLVVIEAVVAGCHDGITDEYAVRRSDCHQHAGPRPRLHLQLCGRRHSPQAATEQVPGLSG